MLQVGVASSGLVLKFLVRVADWGVVRLKIQVGRAHLSGAVVC